MSNITTASSSPTLTKAEKLRQEFEGRKFGFWTVKAYLGYWRALVVCTCGTEKEIDCRSLVNKSSKSCGCQLSFMRRKATPLPIVTIESIEHLYAKG